MGRHLEYPGPESQEQRSALGEVVLTV
jgi:hypothetical protein